MAWCSYTVRVWQQLLFSSSSSVFPSFISGVHHFWVRFLSMWPSFNPTIEVVTFHLRGWCMLGVFLSVAFTRLHLSVCGSLVLRMWLVLPSFVIIIAFKGAIRDFLQSPHSAANCLQHIHSSGPGAVVCKSHATHRALITCKCHVTCHLVRRDSSAIKFDRVEIAFIWALFYWLNH